MISRSRDRRIDATPEQEQAREVMRVQLDPTHLDFSPEFIPILSVSLAITSYADQLALVIADGLEDQRLHLIHVDVESD